jgi:hypothetical protein
MAELCNKDDFLKMLNYDSDNDSDNTDSNEDNKCLISRDLLDTTKVTLPCKHSFNYVPLYKEVFNQKKKLTVTEVVRLRYNQIKCPYCRTIHNYLIPYKNIDGVELVHGVNSPRKYAYYEKECSYVYKRGSNKGNICGIRCCATYCNSHLKYEDSNTVGKTNIKKKKNDENEIVSSGGCNYLFKRGVNKGNKCGDTVNQNGICLYCKKHDKYN